MSEPAPPERHEVFYSGNVQGVGFRYTVREVSQRYQVTGYVQNLPDGRVSLVAEGERAEISRFLGAVDAAMGENIRNAVATTSPATGEFGHFSIRH